MNKKGDAPTIDTNFHLFFGKVEVTMKAAPGTGVVSSIVLESDVLDEIDWVGYRPVTPPGPSVNSLSAPYIPLLLLTLHHA